jgi:hypothetical protein
VIRAPWQPGPAAEWSGPVFVSVTDFVVHRARDLPRVWRSGMQLRRSWPQMDGAVGLWLWALPVASRGGSVSIWRSERDLHRFVRWPVHMAIMRQNRHAGALDSTRWHADNFNSAETWARARRFLGDESAVR